MPCPTTLLKVPFRSDPSRKVTVPSPSSLPATKLPLALWISKLVVHSESPANFTSPVPEKQDGNCQRDLRRKQPVVIGHGRSLELRFV